MRVCFILLLGRLTYHNHLSTFSRFVCYKLVRKFFGGKMEVPKGEKEGRGQSPKLRILHSKLFIPW